jgi:hypothetical protein
MGFVDKEKLDKLVEQIEDKFREMGLTVVNMAGGFNEEGEILIQSTAVVRETAYRQITQDLETREQLNQMAAADHQMDLDKKADAIAAAIEGGYAMDVLKGNRALVECSHERQHEGLCLDCGEEVDDGQKEKA